MKVRVVLPALFVSIAASALAFSQNFAHQSTLPLPPGATEAFAAFDDQTNGFVEAQADHVADAMQFNEHEGPTDGPGPALQRGLVRLLPFQSGERRHQRGYRAARGTY